MARKSKKKRASKKDTARKPAHAEKKKEDAEHSGAPQSEEESASGLFKEAIAAFKESGALPPGGEEEQKKADKDEAAGNGADEGPALKDVEEKKKADPPSSEEGSSEGEDDATGAKDSDAPPKPEAETEVEEIEEAEEAEEAERAESAPATERVIRKTVHKKGEPDSVIEAFEPKEFEVHGSVIKFECRCGKRVSAPAGAKSFVGKCPKCGVRLILPKTREKAPASEARAAPKARPAPAPSATPPTAAAWISRFVAFQIDLAVPVGLFLGLFFLLRSFDVAAGTYWTVALAAAVVAWLVAAVLLPSTTSASLGMHLAGLRYRGPDGGPLSFIEALGRSVAGLVLSPLAPRALADRRGRTPAAHEAGGPVVGVGAGGAQGWGEAKVPGEKDAPDTPR